MTLVKVYFRQVPYSQNVKRYGQDVVIAKYASRGQVIDITDEYELEKLQALGAVVDPDTELPEPGHPAHKASTGDRSGVDGPLPIPDGGGVPPVDERSVEDWSDSELEEFVARNNVTKVSELAEANPSQIDRISDAEHAAADSNDRQVRTSLISRLEALDGATA